MNQPSASALERLMACPGSAALPSVQSPNEYSDAGNDDHAKLAQLVKFRNVELSGVDAGLAEQVLELVPEGATTELAFAFNVATGTARTLGSDIGRRYDVLPTEIPGTADAVWQVGNIIYVLDWKTGFLNVTKAHDNKQLRFLGMCAHRTTWPNDDVTVQLIVAYTRKGSIYTDRSGFLDHFDVASIAYEVRGLHGTITALQEAAKNGAVPDVTEGDHCRYCPAQQACPAKVANIRALVQQDVGVLSLVTPEDAAKAYHLLAKYDEGAKAIRKQIYAMASQQDIPLGDGKVLGMREKQGNEQIDGDVAYTTMLELHGQEVADSAVQRSATKTSIKAALKGKVKNVAAAEREVLDMVRSRGGAIRETKRSVGVVDE